jgi:hypothetical protein
MADLDDDIRAVIKDWRVGTLYSTCPECSHQRKKKRARCLSVTVQDDRAVFCCHNCEIRGVVFRDGGARLSRTERTERQRIADAELRRDTERRIAYARRVWDTGVPAIGTPVERYLRHRGFDLTEIPPALRYARLRHPGTQQTHDVMLAAVGYGAVPDAVHRTFLAPGGNGKARLPDDFDAKLSLGPVRGLPIRLDGTADADAAIASLAIAEGIENALVAVQEFGVPAWSAISAGNLPLLRPPPGVSFVTIMADHDPVGLRKAREAALIWLNAGLTVRLALPPTPGEDFNDMLRQTRLEVA